MEIKNLHRKFLVPEALRDGTIALHSIEFLTKNEIINEFPVPEEAMTNMKNDEKALKFSIFDEMDRFSPKVMLDMFDFLKKKNLMLLYWDSLSNFYYFYFKVPKEMAKFDEARKLIEEIGLKCKVTI